jgi:hypothetical protein
MGAEMRSHDENIGAVLAALNHPNIAAILGLDQADGVAAGPLPFDN